MQLYSDDQNDPYEICRMDLSLSNQHIHPGDDRAIGKINLAHVFCTPNIVQEPPSMVSPEVGGLQ